MQKSCRKCGCSKALDEFARLAASSDGRQPVCRACKSLDWRARYAADPERYKAAATARRRAAGVPERRVGRDPERLRAWQQEQRPRKHGLSPACYLALVDAGCGACGRSLDPQDRRTHIDHDHTCCSGTYSCGRCVRAVLCSQCNSALGYVNDDPARLRLLAEYLERHAPTPAGLGPCDPS